MGRTMPLVAGTLLAVAAPCRAATLESAADRMLSRLCASIMTLAAEQTEAGDATSGGLLCPSQNPVPHGYHTRAAEAVFPLVLCSLRETNAKRRDALRETALRLGDWLVAQEQPEGFWLETPHSWWGTTAHQLLSLAAARLLLPDNLGEERETRWRTAFRRAGDFLVLRIRADKVPTSYLPTAACALILGSRIVPSDAWEAHAKALIEETVRKVTTDGLIVEDGTDGIDVGISLGQTIPLLALYGILADDARARRVARECALLHVPFLRPDGAIDASWGCRSNRWMLWGSFGTYGPFAGLALTGRDSPALKEAAARNLAYLDSCMRQEIAGVGPDLVGYGPAINAHELRRDVCVYPTVTTAVGLALALRWADLTCPAEAPPLVIDPFIWIPKDETLKIRVVHTEGLYATLSWTSAVAPASYPPRGGAVTNLFFEGIGLVQAATPSIFVRPEMLHLPQQRDILPLTPRIEFYDGEFWYANIFDPAPRFDYGADDPYAFSYRGSLCDPGGNSSGVDFRIKIRFEDLFVRKTLKISGRSRGHTLVVLEPVILEPNAQVTRSATSVLFTTDQGSFRVTLENASEGVLLEAPAEDRRYYFPLLPAIRAMPVQIRFTDPYETRARWMIERVVSKPKP